MIALIYFNSSIFRGIQVSRQKTTIHSGDLNTEHLKQFHLNTEQWPRRLYNSSEYQARLLLNYQMILKQSSFKCTFVIV